MAEFTLMSWPTAGSASTPLTALAVSKGRIIEVEVIATGERFHGSARRMERLVRALQGSGDDRRHDRAWTPEPSS